MFTILPCNTLIYGKKAYICKCYFCMRKLLIISILCFNSISFAQEKDSVLLEKIQELTALFEEFSYQPLTFDDTSLRVIRAISQIEKIENFPDRSVYLDKRAEQLENDLGVDIVGGYIENFNLDPIEDLQQNINYQRRLQVGMEWDLLSGGYFENKVRAQMVRDRIQREKLSNDVTREGQFYLQRFDQTIQAFNELKMEVLRNRLASLEKQHRLIRDLVLLKKLKKEHLIEVELRLAEVESLINVYLSYNDFLEIDENAPRFKNMNLPIIDLNYDKIFQLISGQTDSLLQASSYESYYKWYHQVGLKPYVRYNYYDLVDASQADRSFFSAGLNFSVPLRFDTELNNQVEHERWKYENERFTRNRAQVHEDVINTAYEFRFELKRFVNNYQSRRLLNEKLRIERAKLRLSNGADPFDGMEIYDKLMEVDMELIESLQRLYLKALKIHTRIPGSNIEELIKSQSTGDLYEYVKDDFRDVYVWSKTFETYPVAFLAEYAIYNEFNKIIVAVSDKDTSSAKREFMAYTQNQQELYFMLGNNKLFYHKDIEGYLDNVMKTYENIQPKGIHVDIEPHTFDNWDTDRTQLLNEYIVLIAGIKRFCEANELKLEVSVPKHYDAYIMDQLYQIVDKVYFMCYENVDTDFLVRKLEGYASQYPNKTVIALRTEDFANRLDMENKAEELKERLKIKEFAFHDLRRMIAYDRRKGE